jgi:hypothetical protein
MKNQTVTLSLVLATLACAANAAFFLDYADKFSDSDLVNLDINGSYPSNI